MKVISSSIALTVIVGFSGLAMGGTSNDVHARPQILPPPSVCASLYRDCIESGGTEAECEKIYIQCSG